MHPDQRNVIAKAAQQIVLAKRTQSLISVGKNCTASQENVFRDENGSDTKIFCGKCITCLKFKSSNTAKEPPEEI